MDVMEKYLKRDAKPRIENLILNKIDPKLNGLLVVASSEEEFTNKVYFRIKGFGSHRVSIYFYDL